MSKCHHDATNKMPITNNYILFINLKDNIIFIPGIIKGCFHCHGQGIKQVSSAFQHLEHIKTLE